MTFAKKIFHYKNIFDKRDLFLFSEQKSLWLEQQLYPREITNQFNFVAKINVRLNLKAFHQAIYSLINSHEILRTIYPVLNGNPIKKIIPTSKIRLFEKDCCNLNEDKIRILIKKNFKKSFDLTYEEPIRFYLYKKSDSCFYFQIIIHHIAITLTDYAWLPIELARLYNIKKEALYFHYKKDEKKTLNVYEICEKLYLKNAFEDKKYWQKYLSRKFFDTKLPFNPDIDFSRFSEKVYNKKLNKMVVAKLKKIAHKNKTTFFTIMTSAFQVLINRYTKQQEMIFGIPNDLLQDLRDGAGFEYSMGYTLNILPLKCSIDTNQSFSSLLLKTAKDLYNMKKHKFYPFSKIREDINCSQLNKLSNPYNIVVVSQRVKKHKEILDFGLGKKNITLDINGFKYQSIGIGFLPTGRFNLVLAIIESAEGYSVSFHYNSNLFDFKSIQRLVLNYLKLLNSIIDNPETKISDLEILSEAEKKLQLKLWNDTKSTIVVNGVIDRFEKIVKEYPDAIAIEFEERKVSYDELNSLTNQLAYYLQKKGATKQDVIAICLKRSVELIATILAIMKIGGIYLPIDPCLPNERIMFMLEDSKADMIIYNSSLAKIFDNFLGKKISLDDDYNKITKENIKNLVNDHSQSDIAYILYTSGSTGNPKGVEVYNKALINLYQTMQKKLEISKGDRWLALTNISFDIANLEILFPLSLGAIVVLISQTEIKEPSLLIKRLNKNNSINFIQATPSLWQMLLDLGWKGRSDLTLLCGGEELPQSLANRLFQQSKVLWTLYGPTETTIWSSMKTINKINDKITIGKPISNTTFYVFDENRAMVPIGVSGELYIGGIGLAKGYRNNDKLTNEKFVLNPLNPEKKERLYKTGDLVRYLSNGEIEFLRRIDNQIKIRGHRIELGEIESIAKKCKGIKQVLIKTYEIKKGNKSIALYYTGVCKKDRLEKFLKLYLPYYMLPSTYIHLKQFNLTHNGKIDRNRLPIPQNNYEYKENKTSYNSIQTKLLKIFKNILSTDLIDIDSNFITIGGNSLIAARIIFEVNRTFNINLPLYSLMAKPTIKLLAKEIELNSILNVEKESENVTFKNQTTRKIGLSFAQRQIILLEKLNENTPINNIPFVIRFKGNLELKILQKVINKIVQRHEILRTIFKEDLDVYSEVLPEIVSEIKYKDLSNLNNPKKLAKEFVSKEAKKPFKIFSDKPLFRFKLIKVKNDTYWFFLNFHHIIFDGFSFDIFLKELKTLYEAFDKGLPNSLEKLRIQYSDYVDWINKKSKTKRIKQQILWWKSKLFEHTNNMNFFINKRKKSIPKNEGSIKEFVLQESLLKGLKQISKDSKVSLFVILLSIFKVLISRYTKEKDIIIGIPVMGRDNYEFNSLMGCFINIIPLRVRLNMNNSFRDILTLMKKECAEALNNQEVPFELLIKNLKIKRTSNQMLFYQLIFNLLPEIKIEKIGNLEIEIQNLDRKMSHCDLSLIFQESPRGMIGTFEYNKEIFEKDFINRLIKHYKKFMKEIIKNIDCPVSKLAMLTNFELQKHVVELNKQQISYSNKETILQLFEKVVKNSPNAIAIIFEDKKWTFEELNIRSNIIAHALLSQKVQSEYIVAILLERTPEFIAAVLGILKAGGAYLPIDLSEPEDRINSILQDAKPLCVLTKSCLRKKNIIQKTIYIDKLTNQKTNNPNIILLEKHLAYVIYTSGSTGKPKGVEIEYGSINDRVLWKNAAYPLNKNDVILHTYSFNFDGSIINYFWPLCYGATLVIASKKQQFDSKAIVNLIKKFNVTTMDLLPSLIRGILEEKDIGSCFSLKNVFSGGEALSNEIVKLFYKKCSAKLYNTYGPTEATVEVSVWECSKDCENVIAPIGRPIAGAKLYVLDENLNIMPIDVPGELYIGGIGLARGYLNDKKLTEEKFVQNPFSENPEDRLYRTGDLAKYNQNGYIEFLGRIDSQVKIRGFRIDLNEIENSLLKIKEIKQAIVVIKGEALYKHLIAYVKLGKLIDQKILFGKIKEYLKKHIPSHMIPQKIVVLKEIPKLLNGKIDYKLLPEPNYQKNQTSTKKIRYKNNLEKDLHSLWKRVLQCDMIKLEDNFFDIGGNSLLAMRLITTINNEMNISIPLISLFENPTIESFAKLLKDKGFSNKWSPIVNMRSSGKKTPFFCIHPIGGGVWCYNQLTKNWESDRPFYAIQARGLEDDQKPHESIPEMAREYVKNIQAISPLGPYIIGGWSFGGLVAVEVVNQLINKGEEVSLLMLLDTTANIKKYKKFNLDNDSLLLNQLFTHFKVPLKKQSHISLKKQLFNFIDNGGKKQNINNKIIDRVIDLVKANYRSLRTYDIPIIKVNTALIKAKENPEKLNNLGWSRYVKKLKTFHALGDHWAITQENMVKYYSRLLKTCFDYFGV